MIEDISSNYKIHLKGSYGSAGWLFLFSLSICFWEAFVPDYSNFNNLFFVGNAMKFEDQQPFSTSDRDNDNNSNNCAEIRHGAW